MSKAVNCRLTSRVQEMLKDTMHRHERVARPPTFSTGDSDEEDGSDEGDELEHEDAKRTWCICNQASLLFIFFHSILSVFASIERLCWCIVKLNYRSKRVVYYCITMIVQLKVCSTSEIVQDYKK